MDNKNTEIFRYIYKNIYINTIILSNITNDSD